MNRSEWSTGFLQYAGWEVSQEKIVALAAQAAAEGSQALFNPLDTTEGAPGATDYNSVGVKNYTDLESGYGATLATFQNGFYPNLVAQLSDPAGGSAVQYCSSPDLNTWGTGNCMAEAESIKGGDPNGYLTATVAGTGGEPGPPPPPPTNGDVHVDVPELQNGSNGMAVVAAQLLLNRHQANLETDGAFGPATEQAVRNFQTVFELGVDGVIGPLTWATLVNFA